MNDINRKQMKDVIVPENDVMRRPAIVPETFSGDASGSSRIDKNPFFEKPRTKPVAPVKSKSSGTKGIMWGLVFVLVLAAGFVIANYFASATIEVVPITRTATIQSDFTVPKAGIGTQLTYSTATLSEEETKKVPATVEKQIQKKASGEVVIFNAYSKDSQRLIKNTRLESPDHKIFRIDESVVVPGLKVVNGKSIPGSVKAIAYADVAGGDYNIGISDFTIPGFKGDPRYTKFYARSCTKSSDPTNTLCSADSPMDGGFSGTVKVPSDADIAAAQEELKADLKKTVAEKIQAQIPDGSTFFPGSTIIKFDEAPQKYTADDASNVVVSATVSVFFFDTALLTQRLAEIALPDDKNKIFTISNFSSLAFTFLDPVDNVILSDLSQLRFHIAGDVNFVGKIDSEGLRSGLAGKNKKDFGSIISGQNDIYTANATIRPMWNTVFPSDVSRIDVKIVTK